MEGYFPVYYYYYVILYLNIELEISSLKRDLKRVFKKKKEKRVI